MPRNLQDLRQVSLVIRSDLQDTSAHASSPPSAAGKALSQCSRHGVSRQIDGIGGKCYKNSYLAVSSMSSMSWAHYSGPFFPCSFKLALEFSYHPLDNCYL